MKEHKLREINALRYMDAIHTYEEGGVLYKILKTNGLKHEVFKLENRNDIFPGRAIFTNYWFAHAYCCRLNQAGKDQFADD